MNRSCPTVALSLVACLALASCGSKKPAAPDDPVVQPAATIKLAGQWEIRDDGLVQADGKWPKKAAYLFTRYEFLSDGSFTRQIGNSVVPQDARRVAGSWKVEQIAAGEGESSEGIFRKSEPLDELAKTAGTKPPKDRETARGTLILSYTVAQKADIPVGATLVEERSAGLKPPDTFLLREIHALVLTTDADSKHLIIGKQIFRPLQP